MLDTKVQDVRRSESGGGFEIRTDSQVFTAPCVISTPRMMASMLNSVKMDERKFAHAIHIFDNPPFMLTPDSTSNSVKLFTFPPTELWPRSVSAFLFTSESAHSIPGWFVMHIVTEIDTETISLDAEEKNVADVFSLVLLAFKTSNLDPKLSIYYTLCLPYSSSKSANGLFVTSPPASVLSFDHHVEEVKEIFSMVAPGLEFLPSMVDEEEEAEAMAEAADTIAGEDKEAHSLKDSKTPIQ